MCFPNPIQFPALKDLPLATSVQISKLQIAYFDSRQNVDLINSVSVINKFGGGLFRSW